jgi:hypothetical protein
LKHVLCDVAEGKADPGQFTSEAHAMLPPGATRAFYQSLGPLTSFRLIDHAADEKRRTYRYLTVFGNTLWIHQLVLTAGGKIAELGIQPE